MHMTAKIATETTPAASPAEDQLAGGSLDELGDIVFSSDSSSSLASSSSQSESSNASQEQIMSLLCTDDRREQSPGSDSRSDCEDTLTQAAQTLDKMEKMARRVFNRGWKVISFQNLPEWLKDNDYLKNGHRPPLPSFRMCFGSIFRIHTETGNIWTHLIGCLAFIIMATCFLIGSQKNWPEYLVFSAFFLGAILCLGFSCLFHTLYCYSAHVSKVFNKLDYTGIALLVQGSFVPWLYYGFYCHDAKRYSYITLISVLSIACIIVSLWDKFAEPRFRPVRAVLFVSLGLSGVIPGIHYVSQLKDLSLAVEEGAIGWVLLMAAMYISGAFLYAVRVPERWFPGTCDIWFQSHQIFHVLVVGAAFIHFYAICLMAEYRQNVGECN